MANLIVAADNIGEARAVGTKVSLFSEDRLREETQRQRDQQWNEQNAVFLEAYAKLIDKDGVALDLIFEHS